MNSAPGSSSGWLGQAVQGNELSSHDLAHLQLL
jgi:hypothetical protein